MLGGSFFKIITSKWMAKYEEKFIVINRKFLSKLPRELEIEFVQQLTKVNECLPNNKYYVCNQDESYAQKVIDIILEGEDNNNETKNT